MKTIYALLITITTWANGDPTTTTIGYYETVDKCFEAATAVVKQYKETFPENVVHIVPGGVECKDIEVTNKQYEKLLKQKRKQ